MERKLLNRIKVVLAEKNRNNKWLSEQLDKDPAIISQWVTNTTQPNVETLIQISKVLDVTVDELLRTE
jgi:transcriptional regulator with XRE-family HTH domain